MRVGKAKTVRAKRVHLRALLRLRDLVAEIQQGTHPTCADLARKLERSERTIWRDIRSLRDDFQAPIEFDRERNGYRFADRSWRMPQVTMTEAELIAFFSAERKLRTMGYSPEADLARTALGELATFLPREIVVDAGRLADAIRYAPAPALDADPEVLARLAAASTARRTLSIDYYSPQKDERTRRDVDVLLLHERLGDWYAVSWDHLSGDFRDFHAGRILGMEETGHEFAVPAGWDPDEYLRRGFGMFRGGRSVTVAVVFDALQARYALERQFHETQRTEALPGGALRLEFDTTEAALEQVARWVMGYGEHAVAMAPPELRDIVREKLRRAAGLYEDET
jgi:predicted DNA-binding transcriptional regulator YafY